jgi:hypothetical protein
MEEDAWCDRSLPRQAPYMRAAPWWKFQSGCLFHCLLMPSVDVTRSGRTSPNRVLGHHPESARVVRVECGTAAALSLRSALAGCNVSAALDWTCPPPDMAGTPSVSRRMHAGQMLRVHSVQALLQCRRRVQYSRFTDFIRGYANHARKHFGSAQFS